jgi:sortase A
MMAPLATATTLPVTLVGRPSEYGGSVDWRLVLRGVGKTFISVGMLLLLFVAYELWGTGLAEARSQHQLKKDFASKVPAVVSPASSTTTTPGPTTTAAPLPAPPPDAAVAILSIPRIGVNVAIVEGVGVEDLKKGPGHYPNTPLPGQPGNTAIAGHRTTYGHPFYNLNELQAGDEIDIATHTGTYRYSVLSQQDVSPTDTAVVAPTTDNRLTLTTCTPRFSAAKRLVLTAKLLGPATAPPTKPADAGSGAPTLQAAAADTGGLSGKGESTSPAILWGAICAVIWLGAYLVGRRWRRWPTYLLATPVFLLALFIFFENFARFVPANI